MVCKINFDFEVSLSDENDSISSSIDSSDEKCFGYKFVLGDNIAYTTPLEIISVRQSNNCKKTNSDILMIDEDLFQDNLVSNRIPMNNHVFYDKSINNSEEESVADSEDELFPPSVNNLTSNEFHSPLLPLKYELPLVNKFQLSSPVIKPCQNINSITDYCLNEKYRRFQLEIDRKKLKTEQVINKQMQEARNVNLDSKIIPIVNSNLTDTPLNNNEENIIPSDILCSLPIDLLTDFINGDKSVKEIISEKQGYSTKKRKKHKKSKQNKVDKKTNNNNSKNCTKSLTTVVNSTEIGNNVNKELSNKSFWSENENHRKSMEKMCSMDKFPSENASKEIPISSFPKIISNESISAAPEDKQILQPICTPKATGYKKPKSTNFRYKKEGDSRFLGKIDYFVTNATTSDVFITESIIPNKDTLQSLQQGNNYVKQKGNEGNSTVPSPVKCLVNRNEILSNCLETSIATDVTHTIFNEKLHGDHTCTYPIKNDCNDNRTPSTDSGFHEMQSCDPTEDLLSNAKLNLNQESEDLGTRTELCDSSSSTSGNIMDNLTKSVSINDFLNLSSFKFSFINESNLLDSNPDLVSGNAKSKEIDTKQLKINIDETASSKPLCQIDKSYEETIGAADSTRISDNRDQIPIHANSISIHIDLKCSKQINLTHHNDAITTNRDADENMVSDLTERKNTENDTSRPSNCDPFKINYWSSEAAINNEEEISQFLTFQWLKFCEKYTMHKYYSMKL